MLGSGTHSSTDNNVAFGKSIRFPTVNPADRLSLSLFLASHFAQQRHAEQQGVEELGQCIPRIVNAHLPISYFTAFCPDRSNIMFCICGVCIPMNAIWPIALFLLKPIWNYLRSWYTGEPIDKSASTSTGGSCCEGGVLVLRSYLPHPPPCLLVLSSITFPVVCTVEEESFVALRVRS